MRDKNGKPWRLNSQPRPHRGHPRARANKTQLGYIQENITTQELTRIQHLCNTITTPTKVYTMIHKWNHKHWVKVGSPKRRMPYPYALTKLAISICPTRLPRNTCHPRLSLNTCLNKAIHTCFFHISPLIHPIE